MITEYLSSREQAIAKKQKQAERSKRFYLKHKQRLSEEKKLYYLENKELVLDRNKQWLKENKENFSNYQKEWDKTNSKKRSQYSKKYRNNNTKKVLQTNQEYVNNKKQTNELFKIKELLRKAVRNSFQRIQQNKPTNTEVLLGCSWEEAKKHIEALWVENMSWKNYGLDGWHIDHIKPVSDFTEGNLHLMNHISNLQPLWAKDNWKKSNKIV
tara:strand:+ start:1379 stop:2014 length:636 start_codon:yes stop_codon:yes gene_type:complete